MARRTDWRMAGGLAGWDRWMEGGRDGWMGVSMYRHMYAWLEGSVDAYMYSYVSITRFIRPLLQLPALLNLEINMLVGWPSIRGLG